MLIARQDHWSYFCSCQTGNEAPNEGDADMTSAEQSLADDKMRAEIARLLAETKQVTVNTFLAPFLAAAGLMGATAALVKILLLP